MRQLAVREHFIVFERMVDEDRAKEAWRAFVEAHGWTVVGDEQWVRKNPEGYAVIGRLIQTDETLDMQIRGDVNHITLP